MSNKFEEFEKNIDKLWTDLYALPAGKTMRMTSQNGLTYEFSKNQEYGDYEAFKRDNPDVPEETFDSDYGNLVNVFLINEKDPEHALASSDDVHVLDLDLNEVYEDEFLMISHETEMTVTGKDFLEKEDLER